MILDTHMKTRRQAGVRPLHIFAVLVACHAVPAMAQDGGALYKEHCASCHDRRVDRAPSLDVLRAMSPQRILEVLEFGSMVSMTHGRTTAERRAMAEFASGKSLERALHHRAGAKGDVPVERPRSPSSRRSRSGMGSDRT